MKKTLLAGTIIVMGLSVAACGKKTETTTTVETSVEASVEQTETVETVAPVEEEVKITVVEQADTSKPVERTLESGNVTVKGFMSEDVKLEVASVDLGENFDGWDGLYDISLSLNGETWQPIDNNTSVTVSIKGNFKGDSIYRITDDYDVKSMHIVSVSDKEIVFATNHFTVFVPSKYSEKKFVNSAVGENGYLTVIEKTIAEASQDGNTDVSEMSLSELVKYSEQAELDVPSLMGDTKMVAKDVEVKETASTKNESAKASGTKTASSTSKSTTGSTNKTTGSTSNKTSSSSSSTTKKNSSTANNSSAVTETLPEIPAPAVPETPAETTTPTVTPAETTPATPTETTPATPAETTPEETTPAEHEHDWGNGQYETKPWSCGEMIRFYWVCNTCGEKQILQDWSKWTEDGHDFVTGDAIGYKVEYEEIVSAEGNENVQAVSGNDPVVTQYTKKVTQIHNPTCSKCGEKKGNTDGAVTTTTVTEKDETEGFHSY